ncbi:MAG TPA: hypothetical protein VF329_01115 [Gammaproteobacteria bacterium]
MEMRIKRPFTVLSFSQLLLTSAVAAPLSEMDGQGRIVVDGEPTFVHGIYHDTMDVSPPRYAEDFRGDAERIAATDFNAIWLSLDPSFGDVVMENFAYLQSKGILVVSSFDAANAESVVPNYTEVEPLLSLATADDFNSDGGASPSQIADYRAVVEKYLPNVLTFASGAAHPALTLDGYAEVMDAMGLQCYPISNTNGNVPGGEAYELEMCDDMFTFARNELGADYPILPTLQAFKWYSGDARYPTAQELRNMLFTTLQFDPAGVFWYSYYDGTQLLGEDRPALWEELTLLTAEVKQLEQALLHGDYTKVRNPDDPYMEGAEGAWHAAYWELEGQTYVIVTNTDKDTEKAVSFEVPGSGTMKPLFDDARYGDTLRYEGGTIQGTIEPESVHVYVLGGDGGSSRPNPPENLCAEPCS